MAGAQRNSVAAGTHVSAAGFRAGLLHHPYVVVVRLFGGAHAPGVGIPGSFLGGDVGRRTLLFFVLTTVLKSE